MENNQTQGNQYKAGVVFWNVDTQYDFMRNDESFAGKLAVDGARTIEGNLEQLTKLAATENVRVVNTADWHVIEDAEIDAENPNYMTTFPPHCMAGTKGAEYVPATKPDNPYVVDWQEPTFNKQELQNTRNVQIYKNKFDVFAGNAATKDVAEALDYQRVIVYGVATNVCNDFAVMGNVELGKEVFAVVDAMKELPQLPLEETLNKWEAAGVKFVTTEEVAQYLK